MAHDTMISTEEAYIRSGGELQMEGIKFTLTAKQPYPFQSTRHLVHKVSEALKPPIKHASRYLYLGSCALSCRK